MSTVVHGSEQVIEMSSQNVRHVRCALGQSRADFARAFGVDWESVLAWESDELVMTPGQVALLIRLRQQADAFSEKTMLRPALEEALRTRKLGQIHESEVRL